MDLRQLRLQRSGFRLATTNAIGSAREVVESFNVGTDTRIVDVDKARYKVLNSFSKYQDLCNLIVPQLPDDGVESDIANAISLETDVIDIQSTLQAIRTSIEFAQRQQLQANTTPASPTQASAPPALTQFARQPELKLPSFDGSNITEWADFWDLFKAMVHDNVQIPNVVKFGQLKSKLTGKAKQAVDGLPVTNDSYLKAIAILQDQFGSIEDIRREHHSRLMHMKPASDDIESIRSTYNGVVRHVRCLENSKEDLDTGLGIYVTAILNKFPLQVREYVEDRRDRTDDGDLETLTVDHLLKQLSNFISSRERASRMDKTQTRISNQGPSEFDSFPGTSALFQQRGQIRERPRSMAPNTRINQGFPARGTPQGLRGRQASLNRGPRAMPPMGRPPQRPQQMPRKTCLFCREESHTAKDCRRVTSVVQRRQIVQQQNRCFKCFRDTHQARQCQESCYVCRGQHHQALCERSARDRQTRNANLAIDDQRPYDPPEEREEPEVSTSVIACRRDSRKLTTVMRTALVWLVHPKTNKCIRIRCLLDTGGATSCVTQKVHRLLGLDAVTARQVNFKVFGTHQQSSIMCKQTDVKVRAGSFELTLPVDIVPTITGKTKRTFVDLSKYDVVKNLSLADTLPTKDEETEFDMLLSNDYYESFVIPQRIQLEPFLHLVNTRFGWLLTGQVPNDESIDSAEQELAMCQFGSLETQMDLHQLYDLENIGIKDSPTDQKTDDQVVMDHFTETMKIQDGRYYVKFPYKEGRLDNLPDNRMVAVRRLGSLLKRMRLNPEVFEAYHDKLMGQLKDGIIEEVPQFQGDNISHYLPHRDHWKGEKLRIVFDASARMSARHDSLNDCLLRGPVILADLCGCLIRFRFWKYAVTADVQAAFNQVRLQEPDRDLVRFLWLKDTTVLDTVNNIQEYRFVGVPFGVISSPALLGMVCKHLLETYGSDLSKQMAKNLYVDNVMVGTSDQKELMEIYKQGKRLFSQAGMNLREWSSNCREFIGSLDKRDSIETPRVKVLGLTWDTSTDLLCLPSQLKESTGVATKRQVLHVVASFFDPLGLATPCTTPAKIFLKSLKDLGWDEPLSDDSKNSWKTIQRDLEDIHAVPFKRYIGIDCASKGCELHVFCDASKNVYAGAVYIRTAESSVQKKASTGLLFSKARLVPKDGTTIPRMELLAVLIGSRCLSFVEAQLEVHIVRRVLWIDAQVVLAWIRSQKTLKTFVQNRVNEIRKLTNVEFRYVPTKDNPADLPTRGMTAEELQSSIWQHGPPWLRGPEPEWPSFTEHQCTTEEIREVEKEYKEKRDRVATGMVTLFFEEDSFDFSRFGSLQKACRVLALVRKFSNRCRRKLVSTTISAIDMSQAQKDLDRIAQRALFSDLFEALEEKKRHKLIDQLGIFVDHDGILRCGGRLSEMEGTYAARHPKLLRPGTYASLVIQKVHVDSLHVGAAQTLSTCRSEYWITGGRSAVKKTLSRCIRCRRLAGRPYKLPDMPSLPSERVSAAPPFSNIGIDFFGPLSVRSKQGGTKKTYGVIFVCMAIRAVHLELLQDMTTESFLLAFRRFVARRGCPVLVISDNAPQFTVAEAVIAESWKALQDDEHTLTYLASKGISWKKIPAYAPWHGAFYERLIGLIKNCLRKSIGSLCLNRDQFVTLLVEAEAIVNSRPLTVVDSDLTSTEPLSPNDFLSRRCSGLPCESGDVDDPDYVPRETTRDQLVQRWRRLQSHLDRVWDIWRKEYVAALRERHQYARHKDIRGQVPEEPQVGQVVVVAEDGKPRGTWKLARVVKILPGEDGRVRKVEIRFASGSRSIRSPRDLCPIEMSTELTEETNDTRRPQRARPERAAAVAARERMRAT